MMKHRLTLLLALTALLSLSLASCARDRGGKLTGSLQDFYDTDYEYVRARLYSSELAIEYVREDGEVPVRVTVARSPALVPGAEFEMITRPQASATPRPVGASGGEADMGVTSADMEAGEVDEPALGEAPTLAAGQIIGGLSGRSRDTDMPPMESGTFTLDRFEVREGARVKGEFFASFLLGDDEASLSGTFDVELEIIDEVGGYEVDLGVDMGDMGDMGDAGGDM